MKWVKPNGTEAETNDHPETIAVCEKLGWKKKRGRPAKPKEEKEKPEE